MRKRRDPDGRALIELHSVEHEGKFYSHDDLADELARRHGFDCRDQHGAVSFFDRSRELAVANVAGARG